MPLTLREIERRGLRLGEVPGEGRCLVADRAFVAGSVLLAEKPIVRDTATELARYVASRSADFPLLRGEENLAASQVLDRSQPYILQVETNSFIFGGRVCLFHGMAMINHACATSLEENVCFSILNTGDRAIDDNLEVKLVATRDIAVGQPLHTSYHQLFASTTSRTEPIQAHCGGHCRCSLCRRRGTAKDLEQFDRVFPLSAVCQTCGGGSDGKPRKGDLVALLRSRGGRPELEGLHGRVLQRRAEDGAYLVLVSFQGEEMEVWLQPEALRVLDRAGSGLLVCSRCKSVAFCSVDCQRAGWKAHKEFCAVTGQGSPVPTWRDDAEELGRLRRYFAGPEVRRAADVAELAGVFFACRRFLRKWTQPGRSPHLALGHYAVHDAVLLGLPLGTLALWRCLAAGAPLDTELWRGVAELARFHLHHVRSLVPRFHISSWTALHHVHGLLALRSLMKGPPDDADLRVAVENLATEFEANLDVARIYEPEVAESFEEGGASGAMAEGSRLFQEMSQDPSKLEAFYSIDPEAPLDKKMELMSKLLTQERRVAPPAKAARGQHQHQWCEENRNPEQRQPQAQPQPRPQPQQQAPPSAPRQSSLQQTAQPKSTSPQQQGQPIPPKSQPSQTREAPATRSVGLRAGDPALAQPEPSRPAAAEGSPALPPAAAGICGPLCTDLDSMD